MRQDLDQRHDCTPTKDCAPLRLVSFDPGYLLTYGSFQDSAPEINLHYPFFLGGTAKPAWGPVISRLTDEQQSFAHRQVPQGAFNHTQYMYYFKQYHFQNFNETFTLKV